MANQGLVVHATSPIFEATCAVANLVNSLLIRTQTIEATCAVANAATVESEVGSPFEATCAVAPKALPRASGDTS